MTTQTAPMTPTPADEIANRLRTVLGWIDSHRGLLPPGMSVQIEADGSALLNWWTADSRSPEATCAALTTLLGPGDIKGYWTAEGDRPTLHVLGVTA